ncbi:MAG: HAD family hydrolase [Thermoplasmata archaeon]|nr:MAG: HAD family hydrolase [Thermoplasmata archaeon]
MTLEDVRAIIFDLDDTITNFMAAADAAFMSAFSDIAEENGVDVEDLHARYMELFEEFYTLHLEGHVTLEEFRAYRFSRAFELVGLPVDDSFLDLTVDFQYYYDHELETFPGACDVLRELDERYPLGLITNGPTDPQWRKINKFNLSEIFEVILVSGQLGISKPDPRIFDVALEGLRVAPEETVMVGNSLEHDHQGAMNAGIRFIWANHTGRALPDGWPEPDHTVGSFAELRDLLL